MLTSIRERATGWIAWVIVILITIPFALWGIQSYFENASEIPVATVNGEEISVYAYQNELSRQRQALARQFGSSFDPALLESLGLRTQVVESMISNSLINQYVQENNYRVSDEDLLQRIETNPAFESDGQFNPDLYRDLLSRNGLSPQGYEASERQNAAIEQLNVAVSDSSFATSEELNRLLELEAQSRDAEYALIPANRFEQDITVTDDEIAAEYERRSDAYEAPARMKVAYVELNVDDLVTRITPSEEELAEMYEQTRGRYRQAEARKASHILFAVNSSASDEEKAEIRTRAEEVLARAEGGEDFAALAAEFSDDPGSRERGGDLGVVARGQMVMPFEDAVFSMREGDIQGPVETRFGFHVIKLTELTEEQQKPFSEVRDQVVEELARIEAENLFFELGEQFENLVYEDPDSLITVADELELTVQETDWFEADRGEGIVADARVRRAAFSEDVLVDELNSTAIELTPDHLVAVRKIDHEPARPMSLEEVRDEIEAALKRQKSADRVAELGEELAGKLASASDWQRIIEEEGLAGVPLADRRDRVPGNLAPLGDAVFASAWPEAGSPLFGGVVLPNGDYALYVLNEVVQRDIEELDDAIRERVRQQLLARDGAAYFRQFQDTMRMNAEVVIDGELLENPDVQYQ